MVNGKQRCVILHAVVGGYRRVFQVLFPDLHSTLNSQGNPTFIQLRGELGVFAASTGMFSIGKISRTGCLPLLFFSGNIFWL